MQENNKNYIREHISNLSLLLQLAEEATELSQAALKLVRAIPNSDNPTPITFDKACENLTAELCDVLVAAEILGILQGAVPDDHPKIVRWAERLRAKEAAK